MMTPAVSRFGRASFRAMTPSIRQFAKAVKKPVNMGNRQVSPRDVV